MLPNIFQTRTERRSAEEEGAYRLGMFDKKVVEVTVAVKLEKYSIQI